MRWEELDILVLLKSLGISGNSSIHIRKRQEKEINRSCLQKQLRMMNIKHISDIPQDLTDKR